MADNVTGIVLDIPADVLNNIKNADKAIKDLEQTSKKAAQNIKGDFGTTMVSGVEAFIKKVQEAQTKLGGLKMPTIDASGLSSAIQALSQAMATIDKSATTGSNRLTRIANAMTALQGANPDPQLFQNIADGIAKIGNTSQQTIQNVSQLAQVMAQLAKDIRTVQQAQNTQNANTATAAQYNKLYKEQAQLIRDIQTLQGKKSPTVQEIDLLDKMKKRYAEIAQQIDKLNQKNQTAASNLARAQGQMRSGLAANVSSPIGAINYAKQAQSLNQLQAAYKNLKAVMATVDPKTSAWQQMNAVLGQTRTRIDEIKKKMGEFKSQASQVGDVAGQLKSTLAATFSISAITGYLNKLIETRAQFELQQTALRAILQDKQEADKIFQQVQQMALQSPFTIMQMTTFTKQLAAYRIESEKLVGTTKMLADVSAGLGVDISRLILAYGQVKAANYLRACLGIGTKVKMFDGTFKNVEDIVVGDVLMGDDEQPRNVSKLYQGEQQMYRVSYLGGSFRCNEHHILTVYDALRMRVSDVFVLDYLKEPYRYHGVKRIDGEYKTFIMKVEKDTVDTYYGFSIDGNHRFIIEDNIVTHNTEVRQFTEAGLNIAGELATYFSELQGKMISVGDVMEMITKRMVRFEDVEEVFKRVTSAGGLFYDMQKKQSETLSGQLQRIKDAMSIMFNEIGKSNQGTISWFLKAIRELIKNWRILASVIQTGGTAFAVYMVSAKAIPAMVAGLKALKASWIAVTAATKAADAAGKAAAASNPYAILATAAAALLMTIYQLATAQSALNDEFERISEESSKEMWDLIFKFQQEADVVRDTTKSYDERKKALEDLQNTFRGILPDQDLEYENIMKISDGYKDATESIKVYSVEKAKQEAQKAIDTKKQEQWEDFIENSKDIISPLLKYSFFELQIIDEASLRGVVGNIMRQIQEEVEKGAIKSGQAAYDKFIEILNSRFKSPKDFKYGELQEALKGVFNVEGKSTAYIAAFEDVSILWKENFANMLKYANDKKKEFEQEYIQSNFRMSLDDQKNLQKVQEYYNARVEALNTLNSALLRYHDLKQKGELLDAKSPTGRTEEGDLAANNLYKALLTLNEYESKLGLAKTTWDDITKSISSSTEATMWFNQEQQNVLNTLLTAISKGSYGLLSPIKNWIEETRKGLSNLGFSEVQKDIYNTAKKWIQAHGLEMSYLDKLRISAETNYTSAANDAKALSDAAAENVLQINGITTALMKMGLSAKAAKAEAERRVGTTVEEATKATKVYLDLAKSFGYVDKSAQKAAKSQKKTKGAAKDIWAPRLELIKKTNTEYEKLLKYYTEEEAMARVRKSYGAAVAETFKGTQWADISKWDMFDDKATIKRLEDVGDKSGKGYKKKFLEAAGTLQAELDIKIEEKKIQEAKDKIQSLFDNYELTKTLGGLGLNIDLTYLVGGKPVKLGDLRNEFEKQLATLKVKGGEEETVKAYEDALKKVTDLENKNAQERLKNYNKYLLESMSERVQIELKAQQDISKIRNDATLDDFSKQQAINNRRKQMQEDLTKYDFDQFKGSDVYLQTFKDLERASKTQLQYVIDRLKELSAVNKNLSPLQVKAIAEEIKKAEATLGDKAALSSMFSNLKESIKYAKERNNLLDRQVYFENLIKTQQEAQGKEQKRLYELTQKRDAIKDKTSQAWADANDEVLKQQMALKVIDNLIKRYQYNLKDVNKKISAGEKAWNDFRGALSKVGEYLSATLDGINSISEGLDSMGLMSDSMRDGFESASEIIGGLSKMMEGLESIDIQKPFTIISGTAKTIGGIFSTIGGFFGIGDKKKERQIQRLQEKVEDLQKAYEKLQAAIEDAYSFDEYNAGYNQAMKNIEENRKTLQEQMALEEAKKKTDKAKLREYADALDALKEKEKELRESRYEAMGSVSESGVRTEAENFVSAWLDAYKETGDGLDALKEHWNEFFENLVLKQAASAVVSARMKKYVDRINAAIDSGETGLSLSQTFAQIGEDLKSELGGWNEDLKAFFDAVGIKGDHGELLLSDLQKGIQNITEPQAAAIEAYLNSMRFAVFEQNNILTQMLESLTKQYNTDDNNPMLQEVKAIRSLVASIDERLSRVVVNRNSANTSYMLKVG